MPCLLLLSSSHGAFRLPFLSSSSFSLLALNLQGSASSPTPQHPIKSRCYFFYHNTSFFPLYQEFFMPPPRECNWFSLKKLPVSIICCQPIRPSFPEGVARACQSNSLLWNLTLDPCGIRIYNSKTIGADLFQRWCPVEKEPVPEISGVCISHLFVSRLKKWIFLGVLRRIQIRSMI